LSDQDVLGYEYLELDASGDTWTIQQLGHLTVIYPDTDTSSVKYNTLGEDKIIFHANGVTFVWDIVQNHVSMWRLEDLPQVYDVSVESLQGHLLLNLVSPNRSSHLATSCSTSV
jgi:hypothetical protein